MKRYSDATLMSWNKKELILYIRCLEKNYNAMVKCNEQQCKNVLELLREYESYEDGATNEND